MFYYRVQPSKFSEEETKKHRSFYSEFYSIHESMRADIARWIENDEIKNISNLENLDNKQTEHLFNKMIDEHSLEPYYTENGLSCCDSPESLFEYWKNCYAGIDFWAGNTEYCVIEFNGKHQDQGKDGEDIVKLERIENKYSLKEFAIKFVKDLANVYNIEIDEVLEYLD